MIILFKKSNLDDHCHELDGFRQGARNVVANVLYYDIVVSKFGRQLRKYVHFRAIALRKGMNSLIPPAMSDRTFIGLLQGWLVDCLFCFTAYQPLSGHFTPN